MREEMHFYQVVDVGQAILLVLRDSLQPLDQRIVSEVLFDQILQEYS